MFGEYSYLLLWSLIIYGKNNIVLNVNTHHKIKYFIRMAQLCEKYDSS